MGPLTERRLLLDDGLELEVGVVPPNWAATDPVDPGTRRVVTDGMRILHDPEGLFEALQSACPPPADGPSPTARMLVARWPHDKETLDLLATPGAVEEIRQAEADIAAGEAIDADELRRQLAARAARERRG